MGIIYLMLVVSLVIALFFLLSFIWATKTGQYDDDYSPSVRILFEDDIEINTNKKNTEDGSGKV
ncbi:MAG: cbb3-type cytochrome oxidase assembly protein CcoS [Bacteroidota bacterium]